MLIIIFNLTSEQLVGVLGVITSFSWVSTIVALYQLKTQKSKLEAEAHKTDAEAESIKITTAQTLMQDVTKLRNELHQAISLQILHKDTASRIQMILAQVEMVMRELLNDCHIGFWEADKDGYRTHFNQHWLNMTGMTRNDARGDGWSKAIHPDDREKVIYRDKAMMQREATIKAIRCRIQHVKTKKIIQVEKVMFVIYDADGSPYKFLGTMKSLEDEQDSK